jgi:hypothetical protein
MAKLATPLENFGQKTLADHFDPNALLPRKSRWPALFPNRSALAVSGQPQCGLFTAIAVSGQTAGPRTLAFPPVTTPLGHRAGFMSFMFL